MTCLIFVTVGESVWIQLDVLRNDCLSEDRRITRLLDSKQPDLRCIDEELVLLWVSGGRNWRNISCWLLRGVFPKTLVSRMRDHCALRLKS
ncbi:hypothetical protein R1flu_005483 [Riccia fluitans]|uniref:Transposase n=1 Tax=Riccia fluitans TaxID=41844 RepID=A0ABD1YU98_9MARC